MVGCNSLHTGAGLASQYATSNIATYDGVILNCIDGVTVGSSSLNDVIAAIDSKFCSLAATVSSDITWDGANPLECINITAGGTLNDVIADIASVICANQTDITNLTTYVNSLTTDQVLLGQDYDNCDFLGDFTQTDTLQSVLGTVFDKICEINTNLFDAGVSGFSALIVGGGSTDPTLSGTDTWVKRGGDIDIIGTGLTPAITEPTEGISEYVVDGVLYTKGNDTISVDPIKDNYVDFDPITNDYVVSSVNIGDAEPTVIGTRLYKLTTNATEVTDVGDLKNYYNNDGSRLTDGSIGTRQIEDGSVTGDKLEEKTTAGTIDFGFGTFEVDSKGRVGTYEDKVNITGLTDGQVLQYSGIADEWVNVDVAGTILPVGTTSGETLRYNGSTWESSTFLKNSGSSVGIGAAGTTAETLQIGGSIGFELATPEIASATGTSGGTLSPNTYYYAVTALDSAGEETIVSDEESVVVDGVGTTAVDLNWGVVDGAASYRVYKGTATGVYTEYFDVTDPLYTDDGTAGTVVASIPTGTSAFRGTVSGGGHWVGATEDPAQPFIVNDGLSTVSVGYQVNLTGGDYTVDALGLKSFVTGTNTADNVAAWFKAEGGANNYTLRLEDGVDNTDKMLTVLDASGNIGFFELAAKSIVAGDITNWNEAYGWGDHSTQGYLTTETDPVFTASAASGIVAGDLINWNEAYGWGDHSTQGYLTTETDPIFTASAASGIAAGDITNWNTAYGWGDHSLAGYISGAISLDSLSDVEISGATIGDIFMYNGVEWVNVGTGAEGEALVAHGAGLLPSWTPVFGAGGTYQIEGLENVTVNNPTRGDLLTYKDTEWVNTPVGVDGQYLVANSLAATGVEWKNALTIAAGSANYLSIDINNELSVSALAITDVTVDAAADLATFVTASYTGTEFQEGDVIVLTTPSEVYIHNGGVAGDATDFTRIETPQLTDTYIRSLFSKTDPITYNPTTGVIGITQASGTTDGYLSSTDWGTFNNKLGSDPFSNDIILDTTSGNKQVTSNNTTTTDRYNIEFIDGGLSTDSLWIKKADGFSGGGFVYLDNTLSQVGYDTLGLQTTATGWEFYGGGETETVKLSDGVKLELTKGVYSGTVQLDTLTADRTYTYPDASGTILLNGDVDLSYTASTRTIGNTAGDDAILPLFTSTEAGLVPLSGGGTTNFLRADGTWAAAGVEVDVVGIANSNGVYTYYSTLQAAITAASAGDTVELFSDITETADTTVTLKDGVKINGNGHTYTLDVASGSAAINVIGSNGIYYVFNLIVRRINGLTTSKSFTYGSTSNSSNEYHFDGSKFYNTNGDAIYTWLNDKLYNAYGSTGLASANSIFIQSGVEAHNCIGEGVGMGINSVSSKIYNCIGKSTSNNGINMRGGTNCYGYSQGGYGIHVNFATNALFQSCVGESTGNSGFSIVNAAGCKFHNCSGKSTVSFGFYANGTYDGWEGFHCLGYSTVSVGIRGGRLFNCTGISDGAAAGEQLYGDGIYNCTFRSNWDNVAGHAFRLRGGNLTPIDVLNCTLEVTNAGAYCLEQSFLSGDYKIANNTFKGSTVAIEPTGITNVVANTSDSFGNILI